jgi:hypothetical protein
MWIWLLLSCRPAEETPVPKDDPVPPEDTDLPPEDTATPPDDTAPPAPTGTPVSDSVTYTPPQIDVLFVIDASNSMISKTTTLTASLGGMVRDWDDLGFDYHAGVTNIDESNEHGWLEEVGGVKWVDNDIATPGSLLVGMVEAVGDPSSAESGREAAFKALQLSDELGEPNYGFLRDGSQIAIVVHTDEADQSGDTPVTEQEFIDYLLTLRPLEDVSFSAIAATSDYVTIANGVGGVVWSVDNTPYGPALQAITDQLHQFVVTLSQPVVLGTIEVRVTEPDATERVLDRSDWVVDSIAGTIELVGDLPQDGATVTIDYLTPE